MSNLSEEELNRLCWSVVSGAAHGMYSWLDIHSTPEEERDDWMDDEEARYMHGRGVAYLDTADVLNMMDVDVGFRALTYAEEEDFDLYPVWITEEGYEPHFRPDDMGNYKVISEEDEEEHYNPE